MSFPFRTIKKDIQESIEKGRLVIQETKQEIEYTERVIRMSTRQKDYEETYLKFCADHLPPSEYEAQISQMVKTLFESNKVDRDAINSFWQAKLVALKIKVEMVEQKVAELERIRVTEKPAAK